VSPARNGYHHRPSLRPEHVTKAPEDDFKIGPARGNYDGDHIHPVILHKFEALFQELAGGKNELPRDAFAAFLQQVQGEPEVQLNKDKATYGIHDFLEVLMVEFGCNAFQRPAGYVKDLSRPITNYFINSSHNTYLLGNQVTSSSSPDAYRMVLPRGCRCVEIDVWNGDSATPDPTKQSQHGRQLSGVSIPNLTANLRGRLEELRDTSPAPSRPKPDHSPCRSTDRGRESARDSLMTLRAREASESRSRNRTPSRQRTYPRDEPIVTHGWTASRPCGFREVCKAIKESAFQKTDLPIIISLEVHADEAQQETMVRIMKEEWGPLLLDKALDEYDPKFQTPSLADLRNKILVKAKKTGKVHFKFPPTISSLAPPCPATNDDSVSEDDRSINLTSPPNSPNSPASVGTVQIPPDRRLKRVPICPALSSLAIYTYSQHFEGAPCKFWKRPGHIYSISESRILEFFQADPGTVFQHNKTHFMRAFPAGKRIDSSNPDPSPFWRAGVQMVAMNWQRLDDGMMLNEAMFADENGWTLKPEGYRSKDASETHMDAIPDLTTDLKITVFAGQHIFVPGINENGEKARSAGSLRPSVKCELHFEAYRKDRERRERRERESNASITAVVPTMKKTAVAETDHPDFGEKGCELSFEGIPAVVDGLSFVRYASL
jgi:phosphatidylinositol phospholipase C, delta